MNSVAKNRTETRRGTRQMFHMICGLLLAGALQVAKADFVGAYAPEHFSLLNTGGVSPNGTAWFAPDGSSLVLTGSNDGNGLIGGTTDLTIASAGHGLFQFDYAYASLDLPTLDYAGYILNGTFYLLSDTDGEFGSISVPVFPGEIIGFRVGTVDNWGEPGILSVTDFRAPVPEPSTFQFLLIGFLALGASAVLRRVSTGRRRSVALLVFGVAGCASAPAFGQQVFYTGANVSGALSLVGTVDLRQQAAAFAPLALRASGTERLRMPPPRLRPPLAATSSPRMATTVAPVHGLLVTPAGGNYGFNALSQRDQRLASNGNQFTIEPPNQSIAVGHGYVLEGVNNAVQIYDVVGNPILQKVLSSNEVFGLGPAIDQTRTVFGVFLTDMRVFFDPDMDRWIILQRAQDEDTAGNFIRQSHLYLAVSQTADPAGQYNIYIMDTTNGSHPGCPCVDDYPQIGADLYGFHIAWNEFGMAPFDPTSYNFVDATILTLSKAALASGAGAPTAFQFFLPYTTGYEFAIQPATTAPGAANVIASGGVEFFVSTMSKFALRNQVALWAMSNTSSLATANPRPALTRITLATLSYANPDVATQPAGVIPLGTSVGGGLEFLDGGDNRVQSLSYASGRLYLTLPTGVTDEVGHYVVGGAYVVLSPTLRGSVLAGKVLNQGYLVVNGNHLLRPALAVNAQGNGAIAVTLAGSAGGYYPSAAFIPFSTFLTPSAVEVAAAGTSPEDGFTGYFAFGGSGVARWGDYNSAVAAGDGSIWMAAQYIGTFPRTSNANWNTYVIQKQP